VVAVGSFAAGVSVRIGVVVATCGISRAFVLVPFMVVPPVFAVMTWMVVAIRVTVHEY